MCIPPFLTATLVVFCILKNEDPILAQYTSGIETFHVPTHVRRVHRGQTQCSNNELVVVRALTAHSKTIGAHPHETLTSVAAAATCPHPLTQRQRKMVGIRISGPHPTVLVSSRQQLPLLPRNYPINLLRSGSCSASGEGTSVTSYSLIRSNKDKLVI